jgi:hypothetical protein
MRRTKWRMLMIRLQSYLVSLIGPATDATLAPGPFWIVAAGVNEARRAVHDAVSLPTRVGTLPVSDRTPWLLAELSTCEARECPFVLRPGVVVDAKGKPLWPDVA